MKKYIVPSVKVVNIQNETILAGSTFDTDNATRLTTGSLGARERGVFDFEEED